jgi:hypothetical protein
MQHVIDAMKAELDLFKEAFPGSRVTPTGTLLILSEAAEAFYGQAGRGSGGR